MMDIRDRIIAFLVSDYLIGTMDATDMLTTNT